MQRIDRGAELLIECLEKKGHEAWVVGGCVRDAFLGKEPKDWDICTSARPEEIMEVFSGDSSDYHTVPTGLKHGTVTVVFRGMPYEVTTYRIDGAYQDHRHPDEVRFVDSVDEDLSRRDFTINSMAYHPVRGLRDPFHGEDDLKKGIIRCVGVSEKRFEEDALRILRGLRFASVLGFSIDHDTDAAIRRLYPTLSMVASERIQTELVKLLCGEGAGQILRTYPEVVVHILPELRDCIGFEQHNPHHLYDVYEHTVRAVDASPKEKVLRLTMLFHDTGKPGTFQMDDAGIGHMHGHEKLSAALALQAMDRLRMDIKTRDQVELLVLHHDISLSPDRKLLLRRLNQLGEESFLQLLEVQRADETAKGTVEQKKIELRHDEMLSALQALLAEKPCYTLSSLQVRGGDMMELGLRGKEIGQMLETLLQNVMNGTVDNVKEELLSFARASLAQRYQNG